MHQLRAAALIVAIFGSAGTLGAQQDLRDVRSVRLRLERVAPVALDFGVDTAALRQQTVRRLAASGVAVSEDGTHPELLLTVSVPRRLAPADGGVLSVELVLFGAGGIDSRRTLWTAEGMGVPFATYGSLRELVPQQVTRRLDALISARAGT